MSEVIVVAGFYRDAVTERAKTRNSLSGAGHGLSVKSEGRVVDGFVSSDGIIVIVSTDPTAVVGFRPTLDDGTVKWACKGVPRDIMPTMRRSEALHH